MPNKWNPACRCCDTDPPTCLVHDQDLWEQDDPEDPTVMPEEWTVISGEFEVDGSELTCSTDDSIIVYEQPPGQVRQVGGFSLFWDTDVAQTFGLVVAWLDYLNYIYIKNVSCTEFTAGTVSVIHVKDGVETVMQTPYSITAQAGCQQPLLMICMHEGRNGTKPVVELLNVGVSEDYGLPIAHVCVPTLPGYGFGLRVDDVNGGGDIGFNTQLIGCRNIVPTQTDTEDCKSQLGGACNCGCVCSVISDTTQPLELVVEISGFTGGVSCADGSSDCADLNDSYVVKCKGEWDQGRSDGASPPIRRGMLPDSLDGSNVGMCEWRFGDGFTIDPPLIKVFIYYRTVAAVTTYYLAVVVCCDNTQTSYRVWGTKALAGPPTMEGFSETLSGGHFLDYDDSNNICNDGANAVPPGTITVTALTDEGCL